jgi:hypothetical protein
MAQMIAGFFEEQFILYSQQIDLRRVIIRLHFPFSFELNPGDNEAWFDIGELGLNLMRCPHVPQLDFSNMDGQAQPILVLQVDNIHSVYLEFQDKGIDVSEMFYDSGAVYSFNLRDLDGHLSNVWGGFPSTDDEQSSS